VEVAPSDIDWEFKEKSFIEQALVCWTMVSIAAVSNTPAYYAQQDRHKEKIII